MHIPNSCPLIDNVIQAVQNIRGLTDSLRSVEGVDDVVLLEISQECDEIHRAGYYKGSNMEDIRDINHNLRQQWEKAEASLEATEERMSEKEEEHSSTISDLNDDIRTLQERITELEQQLADVQTNVAEALELIGP